MKRQLFDFRLWREGSRQLSLIGVMSFVVMELAAILFPVGYFVDCQQRQYAPLYDNGSINPISSLGGIDALPLLILLPTVIAPLLTLYLFRFLNKRNASDFYHQLPARRECLFLSFFAAIVGWLVVVTVIPTLTCQLLFRLLLHGVYIVDGALLWQFAVNMLVGALLVAASVALVMSVTGNVFNNVVGAGLLIFLPRVVLLILKALLIETVPILPSSGGIWLLDVHHNIPAGMVLSLFDSLGIRNVFYSSASCLYTLVLALIYIGVAVWLFCRRKSESADRAAHSRRIQGILRVVLGFAVSLIPCTLLTDRILNSYAANIRDDLFGYIVLYILVLLAMLIYELITTRRWRELKRAFSSFAVVAGLNVAFLLATMGCCEWVLSFAPTTEEIVSVQFSPSVKTGYFDDKVADLRFEDENIRELVSTALTRSVKRIRQSEKIYSDVLSREVRIHTNGRTAVRDVWFTAEEHAQLSRLLSEHKAFQQAYTELPEWSNTLVFSPTTPIDPKALPAIYEQLKKDIAAHDFTTWYYCHTGGSSDQSPFHFRIGQGSLASGFYVPWSFADTCELLLEAHTATASLIDTIEQDDMAFDYIYLHDTNGGNDLNFAFPPQKEQMKLLAELLRKADAPQSGDVLIQIELTSYYSSNRNQVVFIPLNDSTRAAVYALMSAVEFDSHTDPSELQKLTGLSELDTFKDYAFALAVPGSDCFLYDERQKPAAAVTLTADEQRALTALCEGIAYYCESDLILEDSRYILDLPSDNDLWRFAVTTNGSALHILLDGNPYYYRLLDENEQAKLSEILDAHDLSLTGSDKH